jgi:hypothetical protein
MKKLKSISDKNPFKVPENYFEEVNRKIISATAGYEHKMKKTGIYTRFRPYFLAAASVTLFIIIGYSAVMLSTHNRMYHKEAKVPYEEYSDIYLNEIDIHSIEENAEAEILSIELPEVSKTEIINYLLLENIEINDIY